MVAASRLQQTFLPTTMDMENPETQQPKPSETTPGKLPKLIQFIDLKQNARMQRFLKLVQTASADGNVTPEEVDVLQRLADEMGMNLTEVAHAVAAPAQVLPLPPEVEHNRERLLEQMVEIMLADGNLHEREVSYCRAAARTLGFRPGRVEVMVKWRIKETFGADVLADNEQTISDLFERVEMMESPLG